MCKSEANGSISIRCRRPDQEHPRTLYTPFVGISNTDVSIINDLKQIVGIGEISLRRRILEGCKPTHDWKLISN
jgi:hypothetical protein